MSLNSANKIETNKYELEISVDKEQFQSEVNKVYKKNINKINVPGFRKGKAPRAFVEKLYGEGVFYEDAVNNLYPEVYEAAVEEAKIEPVAKAEVEIVSVGEDGFTFKAKVVVKPEAEIGGYKGLKAVKKIKTVTDDDIDAEIDRVRERNARVISVEDRPAQLGDITVIDFDGSVDGVPFEGGKAEKHSLELGSGQFIPGFEEQVVGRSIGEEFDVSVTFPEDYQAKELAGKAAVFKVKLHEIKQRELPEVDDEFAKDVSEFDTLEAYKEDVKKHLQEHFDEHSQEDVENDLIEQVVETLKAEIPEEMVEASVDGYVNNFDYRLQSQGLNLATYLQYTGMEKDAFRKTFREQAERQVKTRLALEKVAELEGFEATDEDVEAEYNKMAEQYHIKPEHVKMEISPRDVAKDIKVNKAVDLIKSSATITEEAAADEESEEKPAKKAARKTKETAQEAAEEAPATKKTTRKKKEEPKAE